MSILERLGSTAAAGATFAANFWPWLLAAFLLGAGLAGSGGFYVAKLIYQGDALRAQTQLAQFKEQLAASDAMGEREAARRHGEALNAINANKQKVDEEVAGIPAKVAAMLAPQFTQLRSSLNDPKFSCLLTPWPDDALRLLERPGGVAPQTRGDPSPGAGPRVLPDAPRR